MSFRVIQVPLFKDNYSWIIVSAGKAAFVDAAEREGVKAAILKHITPESIEITHLLVTHHHGDHWNAECVDEFPKGIEIVAGDDRVDRLTKKCVGGETFKIGDGILTSTHSQSSILKEYVYV